MVSERSPLRSAVKVGVRVLIAGGLLWLLISQVEPGKLWSQLKDADVGLAAAFAPLMILTIAEMGFRWGLVMRASGLPATFRGAIAVAYTGTFFNMFSIGAAGGDIARAVLVARETDLKARAVGSILFDRIIGMGTLVAAGFVASVLYRYWEFAAVTGAMVGAMAIGGAVYMNPALRRSRLGEWLKRKLPGAATIREMDVVFKVMLRRPGLLSVCIAITAIGQASNIVAVWGLAHYAMGLQSVTIGQCFATMSIIFVVMALPISIGGLGTGEAAFVVAFQRMGLTDTQALSLAVLFRITYIAISLPGLVIFLLGKARTTKTDS